MGFDSDGRPGESLADGVLAVMVESTEVLRVFSEWGLLEESVQECAGCVWDLDSGNGSGSFIMT